MAQWVKEPILKKHINEVGAIRYAITALSSDLEIVFEPYLDSSITNEDSRRVLGIHNQ